MLRPYTTVAATAAIMSLAVLSSANAAVITFDSSSDLTNNFRNLTSSGTLAVSGGTLNLTSGGSSRVIVYDTTPGDNTAATHTTFNAETSPVSVSVQLGSVTTAGSSFGFYFIDASRPESDFGSGSILLNIDNSAPGLERVRVGSFTQPSTGSIGSTDLLVPQQDIGIGVNGPLTTMTATYTRIDNQKSTLALTIGSTTVSQLFTGFWTPKNVEIGLRLFPGSTGTSYQLDNFNVVVPEPALAGSMALAATVLGFRRRR